MSSWLIFTLLGFFPLNGTDIYLLGSPHFDQATLHLPGGDLIITANNNSPDNIYVQSATLNGQPLDQPQFTHAQIVNGGLLEFEMGPEPALDAFTE
jgi:putative alpha-1,2-mannosidase